MKFHRSLIWRVSFIYAVIVIASLAALFFLLKEDSSPQSVADLEDQREYEARLAATLAAPYLADTPEPPDRESLHELGKTLSRWLSGRVTIISLSGEAVADSNWENPAIDGKDDSRYNSSYDFSSDYDLFQARLGNVASSQRTVFHADPPRVLYTAAPVTIDGEVVGVIRLRTPVPEPSPGVDAVFVWLAIWGLAVGTWGVVAIWLVARRSSSSLRDVARASQQLEQGDFDYRVPSGAYEDSHQLTESFNHMADTVKSVIARLSSERDTLSAVLGTMADGVVVTDPGGRVSLFNPAARDLLGIRAEQVEGVRLGELVRDNEIHQLLTRCQNEQVRHEAEVSLILPRRYLSAIATPLDNNGGVLLTLHDLTRMRQVETSQREFVSNVSHELRNPMASIKAMVETLESGAVNDTQVALDFLSRMRGDVDRINGLVNDLLELSRMESGQFKIDAEPMALAPLVQAVKRQFEEVAAAQEVDVMEELDDDLPQIMADGEKLTQVFVNLVENSLKFTPPGGEIRIGGEASEGQVQVVFKDTGVGVAPQHLPHIFERFYKVNRSRRDSGTGLGLSIVKQLVEAHGGQITVESKEGEGCAFIFTLPRVP